MSKILLDKGRFRQANDKGFFRTGDFMERLSNYFGMFVEFVIMGIMFLIVLPFRILYNLSSRLISR